MRLRTQQEIHRCQQRLEDLDETDKAGAVQGLEDWFCQSLFEDGWMTDTLLDDLEHNFPEIG